MCSWAPGLIFLALCRSISSLLASSLMNTHVQMRQNVIIHHRLLKSHTEAYLNNTKALFSYSHVAFLLVIQYEGCSYKFNNRRRGEKPIAKYLARWGKIKTLPLFLCQRRSILTGWKWFMREKKHCIYTGRTVINCHAMFRSLHCFCMWLVTCLTHVHHPNLLQCLHAGHCMRQMNGENMTQLTNLIPSLCRRHCGKGIQQHGNSQAAFKGKIDYLGIYE